MPSKAEVLTGLCTRTVLIAEAGYFTATCARAVQCGESGQVTYDYVQCPRQTKLQTQQWLPNKLQLLRRNPRSPVPGWNPLGRGCTLKITSDAVSSERQGATQGNANDLRTNKRETRRRDWREDVSRERDPISKTTIHKASKRLSVGLNVDESWVPPDPCSRG